MFVSYFVHRNPATTDLSRVFHYGNPTERDKVSIAQITASSFLLNTYITPVMWSSTKRMARIFQASGRLLLIEENLGWVTFMLSCAFNTENERNNVKYTNR